MLNFFSYNFDDTLHFAIILADDSIRRLHIASIRKVIQVKNIVL